MTGRNKKSVSANENQDGVEEAILRIQKKLQTKSSLTIGMGLVRDQIRLLENAKPETERLRNRITRVLAAVETRIYENLIHKLKSRFFYDVENHIRDFGEVTWDEIEKALNTNPDKLAVLRKLEESGFSPDLSGIGIDSFVFGNTFQYPQNAHTDPKLRKETERKTRDDLHSDAEEMIQQYGAELPDDKKLPKGMFRYIVKVPRVNS